MRKIATIGDEAHQRHEVLFMDEIIYLELRFFSLVQTWQMSITYKDETLNGVKLSLGVLHLKGLNLPFDFVVIDNSGTGVDPFSIDDFSKERCNLYMLEPEDLEQLRGYKVEV